MVEIKSALLNLTDLFRAPLEAKGVDLSSILDEIEELVEYSRTYLRIGSDTYKKVWYQLYNSPDAVKWPNILLICELLFSLPFSTAKVERFFSTLKIIKNERRTNLSCSTLNDLPTNPHRTIRAGLAFVHQENSGLPQLDLCSF